MLDRKNLAPLAAALVLDFTRSHPTVTMIRVAGGLTTPPETFLSLQYFLSRPRVSPGIYLPRTIAEAALNVAFKETSSTIKRRD